MKAVDYDRAAWPEIVAAAASEISRCAVVVEPNQNLSPSVYAAATPMQADGRPMRNAHGKAYREARRTNEMKIFFGSKDWTKPWFFSTE